MRWTNEVTIEAPVDVVWQLTVDVDGWPRYTSTMRSVQRLDDGPLRVGSTARVRQPGQPAGVWTVVRLDAGREFSWRTTRPGLRMTGTHRVLPDGDTCRNVLELEANGPLAPLIGLVAPFALRTENAGFRAEAQRRA